MGFQDSLESVDMNEDRSESWSVAALGCHGKLPDFLQLVVKASGGF